VSVFSGNVVSPSRTRNQAYHKPSRRAELLAQTTSDQVVLLQHIPAHFDQSGAHLFPHLQFLDFLLRDLQREDLKLLA
jgi:hypothetical protein